MLNKNSDKKNINHSYNLKMKKYLGNNLNNSNKNIKLQNKYKINNSLNKTEYNSNNNNKIKKNNININSNNKLLNIIQKDFKNKKTSVMPKYYSNK